MSFLGPGGHSDLLSVDRDPKPEDENFCLKKKKLSLQRSPVITLPIQNKGKLSVLDTLASVTNSGPLSSRLPETTNSRRGADSRQNYSASWEINANELLQTKKKCRTQAPDSAGRPQTLIQSTRGQYGNGPMRGASCLFSPLQYWQYGHV